MEKVRNRPKTFKTIAIRVTALVLSLWLVFMLLLTWAVAKDFQNQIQHLTMQLAHYDNHTRYHTDFDENLPGYQDLIRIMQLGEAYTWMNVDQLLPWVFPQRPSHYGSDDWFYGKWDLVYGFEPAVIYYDEEKNVLLKSGNIFAFSYCTEASWLAQAPEVTGLGYIDLDAMEYGQEKMDGTMWGWPTTWAPSSFSSNLYRMTGWFEGSRFHPIIVDSSYDMRFGQNLTAEGAARRDGRNALEWEQVYSVDIPEGKELTTVYTWETGGYEYDHRSLFANGVRYDSLVDYLETAMDDERWYNYRRENLFDSIVIFSGEMKEDPEVDLYALAVRCWPVKYAFLRLIPTYLVSFGLVALGLWLILRSIRRNVTNTLDMLIHRITTDAPIEHLSRWQEPYTLETILKEEQAQRRSLVNDNQQLKASLEFAKNAEENRRQLVSNITHELKTPLAIIHSYAEGLQSGIAEEKKEKYLSTILEEAERMDAMVLEILDHSRLEAGKVRLAADHFSLLALTKSVVEKLTPAAEERQLTFEWGFHNDCFLTADEARLSQVVTNLVSNAIRYAPENTTVWLRVFSDEKDATFQIENAGTHMPEQMLDKLFETFYRAEDSRTGKGTGLGLPIAKSIVELHRGSIRAANTWDNGKPCIQFSFVIPLK